MSQTESKVCFSRHSPKNLSTCEAQIATGTSAYTEMLGLIKKEEKTSDDEYLPAARPIQTKKAKTPKKKINASSLGGSSKAASSRNAKVKVEPPKTENPATPWRESTVPVYQKVHNLPSRPIRLNLLSDISLDVCFRSLQH